MCYISPDNHFVSGYLHLFMINEDKSVVQQHEFSNSFQLALIIITKVYRGLGILSFY